MDAIAANLAAIASFVDLREHGALPMGIAGMVLMGAIAGSVAIASVANLIFHRRLRTSMQAAPRLEPLGESGDSLPATLPTVTVIIPAYNEALNLRPCVAAVLQNSLPDPQALQVIIADDESTDDTAAIAQEFAAQDSRVLAFTVPPRPTDPPWRGKNWACANAVQKAQGDYWLFIDADVRLGSAAIATALVNAQTYQADLLSCAPSILCGCVVEWLVQPVMMAMIAVGFDFTPVNDPAQPEKAFAAGPFMLFRQEAYTAIGGHRAIATNPLEDVVLAQRIKGAGLRLRYVLAGDAVQVRMYPDFAALWEGWTKNFYLGAGRNLGTTLYAAVAVVLIFTVPWLGIGVSGLWAIAQPTLAPGLLVLLSGGALMLQIRLRLTMAQQFHLPLRYLWLGWLGGLLVGAIAIVSVIKTETGWGWTWRGRSLAYPPSQS